MASYQQIKKWTQLHVHFFFNIQNILKYRRQLLYFYQLLKHLWASVVQQAIL